MCIFEVDEEPDPVSLGVCGVGQPPLGLKRKAETPLGSPPEPGQILQHQEDDGRAGRYKIRVSSSSVLKPAAAFGLSEDTTPENYHPNHSLHNIHLDFFIPLKSKNIQISFTHNYTTKLGFLVKKTPNNK